MAERRSMEEYLTAVAPTKHHEEYEDIGIRPAGGEKNGNSVRETNQQK